MDEHELSELSTMEPKHWVSTPFARQNGMQSLITQVNVQTPETHSARTEMVRVLRALADDIEAGLV